MRILSIGPTLGRGGTERALETFSLGYRRLGHTVAVLAWQAGGPRRATLEQQGIDVFVGGENLRRAMADAHAFNPDLIHIHRVGVAWGAETALLRRLRRPNRRVLETNHFGRVNHSEASDCIDVHMHVSRWCLWRWRRWLGSTARRVAGVVVPDPVDVDRFAPARAERQAAFRERLGIPASAFVCGRVGQNSAEKWHPGLFAAFGALASHDPEARLVVLGLPAALAPYVLALPKDIRRRVIDLPLVDSDAALADLYSSLDCFVHAASLGETFGYVLAEAMLCECPVLTASTPHVDNGQVELVGHLTGGIVAASLDALTGGLRRIYSDSSLRETLRPGLRAHVASRFDVQIIAPLAVQIGAAALDTGDRRALQRRLVEIPGCVSTVGDDEIVHLMRHTLGKPRVRDIVEMHIRHQPLVQRAINARLTRRFNRNTERNLIRDIEFRALPIGDSPHQDTGFEQRTAGQVKVSAIMPTFNMARHIGAAVESVLAQTMSDWELVIVDDGSTDDTCDVLTRYTDSRIRVIRAQENGGRPIARNLALRHATGRYIAICDSDDICSPHRFARQAAFLDAHPEVDVVSGQLAHFTEGTLPKLVVHFPEESAQIRERLRRGKTGIAHGAAMLRAECYREHGDYCPDLRSAEDLEFFRRLAGSCTFRSLPDVLVTYRHHLPDPFAHWMASARYHRYALYRSTTTAMRALTPLAYDEFSRRWRAVVLNHTVDLARFTVWSVRSRVSKRLHEQS